MTLLLLAEHDNKVLSSATAKAHTAALKIDPDVHVLVAGSNSRPVAEAAARLAGVSKVLLAEGDAYAHQLPEALAALIVRLADGYGAFVAASTANGRAAMPRIAALLDVMQLSDIVEVQDPRTFVRPIYAGNALQVVRSSDSKVVVTVRTSAFTAAAEDGNAPIQVIAAEGVEAGTEFVEALPVRSERPELTSARAVVSGGRALGSLENFERLIVPLADQLGAAVGASRAAVDAGYAPSSYQVGQTGKIVAPDLYVAAGISGAIQHLAGMKEARVIVAINSDPDAPIFQVADYGLVQDIFTALPEFEAALRSRASR